MCWHYYYYYYQWRWVFFRGWKFHRMCVRSHGRGEGRSQVWRHPERRMFAAGWMTREQSARPGWAGFLETGNRLWCLLVPLSGEPFPGSSPAELSAPPSAPQRGPPDLLHLKAPPSSVSLIYPLHSPQHTWNAYLFTSWPIFCLCLWNVSPLRTGLMVLHPVPVSPAWCDTFNELIHCSSLWIILPSSSAISLSASLCPEVRRLLPFTPQPPSAPTPLTRGTVYKLTSLKFLHHHVAQALPFLRPHFLGARSPLP